MIPSYLIFFLLITQVSFAYTVIFKSGKTLDGTLVTDQSSTIVIKDVKGTLISIKKEMLNLEAMESANAPAAQSSENQSSRRQQRDLSIVQLAEQTKKQRTGKAKVFSESDAVRSAQISVFGSDANPIAKPKTTGANGSEKEWQSRIWSMKKEVNRLREKRITAESACERSREKQFLDRTTPRSKPVNLLSTYKESSQCQKLTEIDRQLQEAELRLDHLREEGRRAGIHWQYLE